MTQISLENLTTRQRYWLITGSVGPRPIGLVTTRDEAGLCNAAPFSAFNYFSEDPALMMIGIDRYGDESHRNGERKDTLNNIERNKQFVVNMVDESILSQAVRCGSDLPANMSEVENVGFSLVESMSVSVPRIAEAPIAWECRLHSILDVARDRSLVLGEIVGMYFRDDLIDKDTMRVNVDRFHPVGRLGGPNYCRTGDRMAVSVPPFDEKGKARV